MDRVTEIDLAEELLELAGKKSAYLDERVAQRPVGAYTDPDRFRAERDRILGAMPQPAVHSSELPGPGSFLVRDVAGLPVLFTRDDDGRAHALLNVCRHRGSRLVSEPSGCRRRFVCPYHAWTYDTRGALVGVPHERQGFPDLDRGSMGLTRVGCAERHGWLWIAPGDTAAPEVDTALAGLAGDFEWFGASAHRVVHTETQLRAANWKLIIEGGLEAYHFRVAHRDTIGPYFSDNLSTYRAFGPHLRSVLARRSLTELVDAPETSWRLREHAQLLYTVFPTSALLVQSDHVSWIHLEPLDAGHTRVRISTLAPVDRLARDDDLAHWEKNHAITVATLNEDFDIGEGIQAGLASGANTHLTFGRFEGALEAFNRVVDAHVAQAPVTTTQPA